jgi:hypothetical protein
MRSMIFVTAVPEGPSNSDGDVSRGGADGVSMSPRDPLLLRRNSPAE